MIRPTKMHGAKHRVPTQVVAVRTALSVLRGGALGLAQWLGAVEHAFVHAVAPRVKIASRKAKRKAVARPRQATPTKATKPAKADDKTPGAPRRVSRTARRRSSHEPEKRD